MLPTAPLPPWLHSPGTSGLTAASPSWTRVVELMKSCPHEKGAGGRREWLVEGRRAFPLEWRGTRLLSLVA